jgi:hypothetical protein
MTRYEEVGSQLAQGEIASQPSGVGRHGDPRGLCYGAPGSKADNHKGQLHYRFIATAR